MEGDERDRKIFGIIPVCSGGQSDIACSRL